MSLSQLVASEATPLVIRAKQLLTMDGGADALREAPNAASLQALRDRDAKVVGLIEDGAVWIKGGVVGWVGPWSALDAARKDEARVVSVPCVTPGWVDCHTHAVFAGSRHEEFTLRNLGASYLDILESGGGILSSVKSVRRTPRRELVELLVGRCYEATRRGVCTMEVKSGYGLATDEERKQLRAIQEAQHEVLVELVPTFLGAHAVPLEFRDKREAYIEKLCQEMIPKVAKEGLARFCDVFCDRGAFTAKEAEAILRAGLEHGLIPKIHADELSSAGAAEVAAAVGAASADHLEFVSDAAIGAMARAGVVGVLLPGVHLYLHLERRAPARALLRAGVEVALATDFNPGTSMTQDLGLILNLACAGYGMTPGEALRAVTLAGAKALRMEDRGVIAVGKRADLTVLGVDDYWEVPYGAGRSCVEGVIRAGELVYWTSAEDIED